MIEAVLFDMGGTLETYSYTEQMRRLATPKLNELLVSYGIDLGLQTDDLYQTLATGLKQYKEFSVKTEQELPSDRIWTEYIFSNYPQHFEKLVSHSEDLMYWIDINFYLRKLRPEVPHVLADLKKRGFKLGLISNVASRSQVPENLKKYGIYDYFSLIVLSSEYGRRKPDPAIFHHAATLIGTPTSRCAYIGDRVVRDIAGARRAGYGIALQISHDFDHGECDDGPTADAVIHNLAEITPFIDKFHLNQSVSPETNRIKALFFDAGDILYYRPRRGKQFDEFLAKNGIDHPEIFRSAIAAIKQKAFNGELNREAYFSEYIKVYGIDDPIEILRGCEILAHSDDDIIFFDGVSETLHELKRRGYLLGIITDTAVPTSNKLRWFEAGGFGDVWDVFISSRDVGYQKPDQRIFQAALHQVHLPEHQACFIGHSSDELDGAHTAGMHTIAFNPDPDSRAEYYAEHFADLLEVVESIKTEEAPT